MENPEVAQAFEETADLLEIQGANPFRVRAYRTAARTIRDLGEPLARILNDPARKLDALPGIGKDLAGKIQCGLETGAFPFLEELRCQVPAGLCELIRIPGLGPRKALILFQKLQIDSLDKLRRAALKHRLRSLRGFGAKTEESILRGLEGLPQTSRRTLLAEAKVYAEALTKHLQAAKGIQQVVVAGSYRRRKDTIGDLDALVTCSDPTVAMERLAKFEGVAEILARGPTKMTVRLRIGLQLDLRVVAEESYGAALVYFTGSKAHNILLRRRALDRKLKINEYGVFRGKKSIAGRTEEEVYAAVDLPWIPPELREARDEIDRAQEGRLPKLIELTDIRGDLHMHTTVTDGRATLEKMAEAARKRGHSYIAVTDHSKQ